MNNSLLPGSAILRSAALFMVGLAVTLTGGLLMWPDTPARDVVIDSGEAARDYSRTIPSHAASETFARLADAMNESDATRRSRALQEVAAVLAADDVRTALDIAPQITGADSRVDFLRAVFVKWAEREPAQALAHALTYRDGGLRTATVSGAVKTWAAAEPVATLSWLEENINGSAVPGSTRVALHAALDFWAVADAPGTQKWVATLPSTDAADRARVLLGEAQIQRHPVASMRYAEAIDDPALRDAACIKLYRLWHAHDSPGADAWLNQSAPPRLRARLVQR